jgi:hypothetical protein
VRNLSPRDLSVARSVCQDWMFYIADNGKVAETMQVCIEDNKDPLMDLANSSPVHMFTTFKLKGLDLTRDTLTFWKTHSDLITRLEFVDCALPRGNGTGGDQNNTVCSCTVDGFIQQRTIL